MCRSSVGVCSATRHMWARITAHDRADIFAASDPYLVCNATLNSSLPPPAPFRYPMSPQNCAPTLLVRTSSRSVPAWTRPKPRPRSSGKACDAPIRTCGALPPIWPSGRDRSTSRKAAPKGRNRRAPALRKRSVACECRSSRRAVEKPVSICARSPLRADDQTRSTMLGPNLAGDTLMSPARWALGPEHTRDATGRASLVASRAPSVS